MSDDHNRAAITNYLENIRSYTLMIQRDISLGDPPDGALDDYRNALLQISVELRSLLTRRGYRL